MRRATHKPDAESSGPHIVTSRGSRNTFQKEESETGTAGEKGGAVSQLSPVNPNKNAQKPAQGAGASAPDIGAELSYGFAFEKKTGVGTVAGEVRIAAEKEKARFDAELENEGEEEDAVKLFDTAFKTGLSEEGFKNSVEGSALSADVAEFELYPGVKVAVNVSALNAELDEEDSEFSLFKIEGEISGKIEDPKQVKGTWMDTPAVNTLLSRGYSVSISGSLSYTINDAAELKRIRDFIALRRKLAPLASKLEGALEEVKRLKGKHLDYVADQTKKFMEKNGIKQYADMTRKQSKALKAFLKKNTTIKKMKVGIVAAKKTVREVVRDIKPIVSKMKNLSKGMKTVVGKVAAKVGLKVASKLLLKAIPIINVISTILDIITLIRFYDVSTAGGEGESPNFWDEVPDKRPEGGEPAGDSKKSGGSATGEKDKDGKESGGSGNEKVPGATGDISKDGKTGGETAGSGGETDGTGGERKEGQGTKPEGTEENGPGADVAKALEAESGDGPNKEVLSGDGEKDKETEGDKGKGGETENKNTTQEAGTAKEEKELAKDQKSGTNSSEKSANKEEDPETSHYYTNTGESTLTILPHVPAKDLATKFIFPKNLTRGEIKIIVKGTITTTGDTFTIDGLRIIVVNFDSKTISLKIPEGTQTFIINDAGRTILYVGTEKDQVRKMNR